MFPIQTNGFSGDWMLAMPDQKKCPKLAKAIEKNQEALDKHVQKLVDESTVSHSIKSNYLTKDKWQEFCQYVFWADTEGVALKEDAAQAIPTCQTLGKYRAEQMAEIDSNLGGVSTNDIRQTLNLRLYDWYNQDNGENAA